MFTEEILQMTKKPVVFADQKMTVPTERLVRMLTIADFLGLDLINLTYLGAPFVDPGRSSFDLLKPRLLTRNGIRRPSLSKDRIGQVGELTTQSGASLRSFYKDLATVRARDFRLNSAQIEWLLNPQEFDMTNFYLGASGRTTPTRESIVQKYLPAYWQDLGESQVPVITDTKGLAESCKKMVEEFGVQVIDLADFSPTFDCPTPTAGLSGSGFIDLSTILDLEGVDALISEGLQNA